MQLDFGRDRIPAKVILLFNRYISSPKTVIYEYSQFSEARQNRNAKSKRF